MITVDEALRRILELAQPVAPRALALDEALGCVLAEAVASDVDSPPYDKSLMDGYAVLARDLANGPAVLDVLEQVTAGQVPTQDVASGKCTRIMTGAPLPQGADAVVMIEETQLDTSDPARERVRIETSPPRPGQNILPQAVAMRRGDVVLTPGRALRPCDLGLLCEVGRDPVAVHPAPTVAVLSTGDELVPATQLPGPGQIRNSNGPMLAASARQAGANPLNLGIARDTREELSRLVAEGLKADVLVLSGGVSAGVLDLAPEVLAELGVRQVFHKVRLKPGKPLWFGVLEGQSPSTLVFGLPGNPVSSFVCFELFVRPALRRLAGREDAASVSVAARLAAAYAQRGDRPTYHPAMLRRDGPSAEVELASWQGSADLRALARANALACFPSGVKNFAAGEEVRVIEV